MTIQCCAHQSDPVSRSIPPGPGDENPSVEGDQLLLRRSLSFQNSALTILLAVEGIALFSGQLSRMQK